MKKYELIIDRESRKCAYYEPYTRWTNYHLNSIDKDGNTIWPSEGGVSFHGVSSELRNSWLSHQAPIPVYSNFKLFLKAHNIDENDVNIKRYTSSDSGNWH